MGLWKDNRIWQALMASVVNLPPARRWWSIEPFLFLHEDGRVSLYDERVHPKVVD
ncbi:MAG: hypothetical protein HZA08_00375 [Nitrospirae bacterium]|nr:hypothetical protein [Nitrospirota bacterium]